MITEDELDRRLAVLAGTPPDDLPELPAGAWAAITRPEPATVLAARQLAEEARAGRPSWVRRNRRRLVGAAAAGVAAGAVVVTGLPGGGGTGDAFADWTSVPEPVSRAEQAGAEASCTTTLAETAGVGGVFAPLTDPTAVLVDRRGSWTYTVLVSAPSPSGEQRIGDCLQLDSPSRLGGSSLGGDPVAPQPATGVVVVAAGSTTGVGGHETASTYAGRSAPDVVAVSVLLPDGNAAEALLRNGWWSVWFPGDTIDLDPDDVVVRTTLVDGTAQDAPLSALWG